MSILRVRSALRPPPPAAEVSGGEVRVGELRCEKASVGEVYTSQSRAG
jgi:hypothetical protein